MVGTLALASRSLKTTSRSGLCTSLAQMIKEKVRVAVVTDRPAFGRDAKSSVAAEAWDIMKASV